MKRLSIIIVLSLIAIVSVLSGCGSEPKQVIGVWWWDSRIDYDTYLNFCIDNGVNEVYFYDANFQNSANFIAKTNKNNIDTYWLIGDYQWLTDRTELINKVEQFIAYNTANPKVQYKGIHLDIEPHQNDNFDSARQELITSLVDIVYDLKSSYPNVHFEYDIPFWLEDEIVYLDTIKPAYQHIMDYADRTFIMSYRDNAQDMLSVSQDEIAYANSIGKPIILGAETGEIADTPEISYYQHSNTYMLKQLAIVRQSLGKDSGVCVHHIKDWYSLAY